MNNRCDQMDTCIEKIAAHLGSTDNDPRRWWAARRERNTEIIDMYKKGNFSIFLPRISQATTTRQNTWSRWFLNSIRVRFFETRLKLNF